LRFLAGFGIMNMPPPGATTGPDSGLRKGPQMSTKTAKTETLACALRFQAEAYSPQARATIPAHWLAEVDPAADPGLTEGSSYAFGDTKEEALETLREQLRDLGVRRSLKVEGERLPAKRTERTFTAVKNGVAGKSVTTTLTDEEALTVCGTLRSSFAQELHEKGTRGRYPLSEAQMVWVHILAAEATQPKAAPAPAETLGDVAGIIALFERAKAHLKFPKVRLALADGSPVVLNRAGERAKVPGSIGVSNGVPMYDAYGGRNANSRWYGRINVDGSFEQAGACTPEVLALLKRLAAEPEKVGSEYGKLTGNCCFCCQALTDERSTSVGYGKTCAGHWGLPYPTFSEVRKPVATAAKRTRSRKVAA
jgi:hypothetical protein